MYIQTPMALIDQMTQLAARLNRLHTVFGDPRYPLVQLVTMGPPIAYDLLVPNPKVTPVDPAKVGRYLTETVQILGDESLVSGIPRTYSKSQVTGSRYLFDTLLHEVVYLDETDPLVWSVLVRPFRPR